MAQYLVAAAAPSRAITVTLLRESDLSLIATASSAVELAAGNGIYTITFSVVPAGSYRVLIVDDLTSSGIASYNAVFEGVADEVVQAAEYTAGGDTGTKLDQIIAAITPITTVYNAQPSSETISLVRGDAYDGQANAKLSWTASKDVDAQTVNFTIRDSKDVIILDQDTTGVTTSATGTLVEVSLSTAATELLDPAVSVFKFDVEIEFSADSRWTITKGNVCVESDQSR